MVSTRTRVVVLLFRKKFDGPSTCTHTHTHTHKHVTTATVLRTRGQENGPGARNWNETVRATDTHSGRAQKHYGFTRRPDGLLGTHFETGTSEKLGKPYFPRSDDRRVYIYARSRRNIVKYTRDVTAVDFYSLLDTRMYICTYVFARIGIYDFSWFQRIRINRITYTRIYIYIYKIHTYCAGERKINRIRYI